MLTGYSRRIFLTPCPGGLVVTFLDTRFFGSGGEWERLRNDFGLLAQEEVDCVWIDMQSVDYAEGTFFGALITLYRKLTARGIRLVVTLSPGVRDVCRVTKLDQIIQIEPRDGPATV